MNKYLLSLGLASVLLTSCKDDDVLPLTPDLVTVVKAYDLDNNSNSSDIRVDFNVRDNNNVTKYRVMVISSNNSNSFDVGNAITLPEERYLEVVTEIFNNDYSITRLPSNFIDVNGEQIQVNLEYVVAVLVVGTGNHQLSEFSRPLTLTAQGIYSGDYEGILVKEIIEWSSPVNEVNCATRVFSTQVSTTITGSILGYKGRIICTDCNPFMDQGPISFMISDNIISNFLYNQTIVCWQGCPCAANDPCEVSFTGQGTVNNELSFEIPFSGDDCVGSLEITLSLFRQ